SSGLRILLRSFPRKRESSPHERSDMRVPRISLTLIRATKSGSPLSRGRTEVRHCRQTQTRPRSTSVVFSRNRWLNSRRWVFIANTDAPHARSPPHVKDWSCDACLRRRAARFPRATEVTREDSL